MWSLQLRMWFLLAVLFGIVYSVVVMVGTAMGVNDFNFYLIVSFVFMVVQYLIGPKIVEWTMHIKYIKPSDNPRLYAMVQEQAKRANISMPKVCISPVAIPNAFAFGRGFGDGRVCVTEGILKLLDEAELKAVLGHEIAHLRNNDVLTITLLSVIPMIMYRIAWHFMFYGHRRDDRNSNGAMIGLIAFLFYFITNLLVLYASRIREYFADRGSIEFGNRPATLASALYKLVYGSARADKSMIREAEGLKAFFVNDPSRALTEFKELSQLDMDKNGAIDPSELERVRQKTVQMNFGDKLLEILSTHPNMLKRIKHLSEINRPY